MLVAEQVDIICLQETHLRKHEERFLSEVYKVERYHASAPTKTKGVMIGFSKKLKWKLLDLELDPNGRFIIVIMVLWGVEN